MPWNAAVNQINGIIGGVVNGVGNLLNYNSAHDINGSQIRLARELNNKNIQFQKETNEQNRSWQLEDLNRLEEREDNAIQRRQADLKAAGINPLMAAMQNGAQASGTITTQGIAPRADHMPTLAVPQMGKFDMPTINFSEAIERLRGQKIENEAKEQELKEKKDTEGERAAIIAEEAKNKVLQGKQLAATLESILLENSEEMGKKDYRIALAKLQNEKTRAEINSITTATSMREIINIKKTLDAFAQTTGGPIGAAIQTVVNEVYGQKEEEIKKREERWKNMSQKEIENEIIKKAMTKDY